MKSKSVIPGVAYVVLFAQFVVPFMFSGVGIILPAMGQELNATGVQLGLIETIYLGAGAAFLLPIGKWADANNRVNIFKLGLAIFALSSLFIGFLSFVEAIIIMRFIQGVFSSLISATGIAILTDLVAPVYRGRIIGLGVGAIYAGLSGGPFLAGLITTQLGWRWVYFVCSGMLFLAFFVSTVYLKGQWRKPANAINVFSSLFIVAATMSTILGAASINTVSTENPLENYFGYALLVLGFFLAMGYAFNDLRSQNPLIDLRAIKNNNAMFNSLVVQLLMYSGAFGTTFLFSLYLQDIQHYSASITGQILMISPILMAVVAPLSGRLSDSYSPYTITAAGVTLVLISVVMATLLTAQTHLAYILGLLLIQGLGFAFFSSPNMSIVMQSVPSNESGLASALSAKTRSLGMVFSMVIVTISLSLLLEGDSINHNATKFMSVMQLSYIAFSICACAACVLAIRQSIKHKKT